jgi:hypothetical protein
MRAETGLWASAGSQSAPRCRSETAAVGLDIGLMKREHLSAMHQYLLVLLSCVWLGVGDEGPPACEPLTYFGVQGCQLSAQGSCPKGYHKQLACPTNPMMQAPCRQMCVADPVPEKKVSASRKPVGSPGQEARRLRARFPTLAGLRPKSVNTLCTSTSKEGIAML